MTKVLIVVEALEGGILTVIASICHTLADDFEFTILHGKRPGTPENLPEYLGNSIKMIPWDVPRNVHPTRDLRSLRILRESVMATKPDLIHAFSSKAGALARIAYPFGNMPVCYSPSAYAFLRRDVGVFMRLLYWSTEWLLGQTPSITIAGGLGEYALANKVSRRVELIFNGVEIDHHGLRDPKHFHSPRLRVVSAGRISPQKNFPLFCDVARQLRDEPFDFKWIGNGDIPADLDLPANVEVVGSQPHGRVLELMQEAHLYLQTSLYETLSLSVLESQSLGLPVLANPAIGNNELIIDGENGYLCATVDEFVTNLKELEQNRDELARLSETALVVVRNYDRSSAARRWRSLYKNFHRYRQ